MGCRPTARMLLDQIPGHILFSEYPLLSAKDWYLKLGVFFLWISLCSDIHTHTAPPVEPIRNNQLTVKFTEWKDGRICQEKKQAVPSVWGDNSYVSPFIIFHLLSMMGKTEWKTVEGFRKAQCSFIHHSHSVSVSILLLYYAGEDVFSLLLIFLFSPPLTVNKSRPLLTRRTCHRWRLPFYRAIL